MVGSTVKGLGTWADGLRLRVSSMVRGLGLESPPLTHTRIYFTLPLPLPPIVHPGVPYALSMRPPPPPPPGCSLKVLSWNVAGLRAMLKKVGDVCVGGGTVCVGVRQAMCVCVGGWGVRCVGGRGGFNSSSNKSDQSGIRQGSNTDVQS